MGKMHFNKHDHPKNKVVEVPVEDHQPYLVALKQQQILDRKRRLQLIKKIQRERSKQNRLILILKLAVVANITLSLIALFGR